MGKELLLVGVILILVGLVVSFIPVQLKLTSPDSVNFWVGFPLFLMGVIIIARAAWIVLKKDGAPFKKEALKRAKGLVESWEKEFSDYYIDSVVADLEVGLGFPLPKAKCTLKVTMKKEK